MGLAQRHVGQAHIGIGVCGFVMATYGSLVPCTGMGVLRSGKEHPSARCGNSYVIERPAGKMRCDSIVVPESGKQAWLCHKEERVCCLVESGQMAPLIIAKKVKFFFHQFYGYDTEASWSLELTSKSNVIGHTGPEVLLVVYSPVKRHEGVSKLNLLGDP